MVVLRLDPHWPSHSQGFGIRELSFSNKLWLWSVVPNIEVGRPSVIPIRTEPLTGCQTEPTAEETKRLSG